MKKILFRVDSSNELGFGHTMRCSSLSKYLSQYFEIHWIQNSDLEGYVKPEGIEYFNLMSLGGEDSFSKVNEYIRKESIDCIIIDSYETDLNYEKNINCSFKVALDDYIRPHSVDLVVNQNSSGLVSSYKSIGVEEVLCGPEYALVNEKFFKKVKESAPENVENILVSFGGADPLNSTLNVLRALVEVNFSGKVVVILREDHITFIQVQEVVKERSNFHLMAYTNHMEKLMLEADLFIGAYGSTTWERMVINLPGICFSVASNQRLIQQVMENSYLGWTPKTNDVESWKDLVLFILEDSSQLKKKFSNIQCLSFGRGVFKIGEYLREVLYE